MAKKILFLCTHNAARSQMAEALANKFLAGYEVASAGSCPGTVHPLAVAAMREIGVDMNGHRSKHLREFLNVGFDYVVTLCAGAEEACPHFPLAKRRIHRGFVDPAAATGSAAERLESFRNIRDAIKAWLLEEFAGEEPTAKAGAAEGLAGAKDLQK